jgi:predicted phosphodiesterase
MRFGLLSDIHGNLTALNAARAGLADEGPLDAVIVAGDLLGGGPRPRAVWEVLTAEGWHLVQGNEDAVVAGLLPPELDPGHPYQHAYLARHAWTIRQIDASLQRSLGDLPRGVSAHDAGW